MKKGTKKSIVKAISVLQLRATVRVCCASFPLATEATFRELQTDWGVNDVKQKRSLLPLKGHVTPSDLNDRFWVSYCNKRGKKFKSSTYKPHMICPLSSHSTLLAPLFQTLFLEYSTEFRPQGLWIYYTLCSMTPDTHEAWQFSSLKYLFKCHLIRQVSSDFSI